MSQSALGPSQSSPEKCIANAASNESSSLTNGLDTTTHQAQQLGIQPQTSIILIEHPM